VNRTEKETVVAELHENFGRASVALIATNRGLTVGESTELRRIIRNAGGYMRVAKHTLTRRALADTRYGDLVRFLEGPRGLVFGFDDPVGVAKVLVDFAEAHPKLEIDGGALEGQVIEAKGVENLAKMPDLPTLQARIARQVLTPGSRIASQLAAPATRIAGAIAARVEQLEEGGEA
jgi:large subunit ribosomal protein L10